MPAAALAPLPLALALGSAVAYGAADFAGGMAARRASAVTAAAAAQSVGLVLVGLLVALAPPATVTRHDLLWGALSGLCGGLGLACFFGALASGRVSTVAPISAVISAALPVTTGVLLGERPTATAIAGILVAGCAIVLVSRETPGPHPDEPARTPAPVLLLAAVSGLLFGGFFTALSRAEAAAGFWPLLANRALSVPMLLLLALRPGARPAGRPGRAFLQLAVISGVLDVVANGLFFAATARGPLSLVAPLGALYPASTVLLAVVLLRERLGTAQRLGLALTAAALMLIGV